MADHMDSQQEPYVSQVAPEIEGSSMEKKSDEKSLKNEGHYTVQDISEKVGTIQDGVTPLDDVQLVMDKVSTLTVDECRVHIEQLLKDHEYDYNFSAAQRARLQALLAGPLEHERSEDWELQIKTETAVNKYYSPYPEVRAVTTPDDDPNILCETIRAHFLGYLWAVIGQFINSLFNSRFPAITFQSAIAQILLYPSGLLLAWILPDWGFTVGGKRHSLNPGPWTYKEQMLSTIIVDVGLTSAYVFWNIQTQTVYYHDTWLTPAYKILLLLSTQLMGLGFAGLLRRFVVYPTQTFWPSILPTLALNRALLVPSPKETIHGWTMSRYKFFFIAFAAMFVYYWIPATLFSGLSYFAWMTWIAPNNFNLAVVTGSDFGLGFNPISSFDWNVFATYSNPLIFPFFSFVQQYIGTVLGGFIILGIYYSNVKWTSYLPPNTSGIFDNTGASYNISRVVQNGVLNEAEFKAYSPAFYGAGNLVVYGAFFAFYTLTFVFILLDSWRPIVQAYRQIITAAYKQVKHTLSCLKSAAGALARGKVGECAHHLYALLSDTTSVYEGFDDPFTNMMRNYPEVPDWWFLAIMIVSFIFALILLTQFPDLKTPVWTIFFVIGLNVVFLIPMTYLYAISGTTEGLNVVTELIVGYALPGHPEALMFVKAFGYNINGQADNYISDQKMGLYAKLPPRAMYRGQVTSAIITAFVCYGVVQFVDNDISGICTPDQAQHFNCENGSEIYFASSVIWGAIGPKRIFGQIYPALKYCFLLGFLLALLWWTVKRTGPKAREWCRTRLSSALYMPLNVLVFVPLSWLRDVHPSLIINGMLFWAPLNLSYFTTGLYFSIFFMYYLKRYKTAWWEKYNYVLTAALNGGVAFSGLIIFFAVQYHPKSVSWVSSHVLCLPQSWLTCALVGKQHHRHRGGRIRGPTGVDPRSTCQGVLWSRHLVLSLGC
jgi:OPT family small oligopeptide transporter